MLAVWAYNANTSVGKREFFGGWLMFYIVNIEGRIGGRFV